MYSFKIKSAESFINEAPGENMLVLWKTSFVYNKGKPVSSWLISKSSDIFIYKVSICASNSWPVFSFALSSAFTSSSLLTRD